MKLTIQHNYIFKKSHYSKTIPTLLSANAWDQVRTQGLDAAYQMPTDRDDWIKICEQSEEAKRTADAIIEALERKRCHTVISVGVGRACVEYHIKKKRPAIRLICTEYSPLVVSRIRLVFTECDKVMLFDMLKDEWSWCETQAVVLLHRVDTEIDDLQWRQVFSRIAGANISDVLIVMTEYLGLKNGLLELVRYLKSVLLRQPLTHAGYLRTRSRMEDLWSTNFMIQEAGAYGSLSGYWLRSRKVIDEQFKET